VNTPARARTLFALAVVNLAACAAASSSVKPSEPPTSASPPAVLREFSLARLNRPIVRYAIDGQTYYYVRSPCCDMGNRLYDAQGNYVCAPDGGFAGRGDGKCGNLRLDRSEGVVVPNPFYKP
jgi:hypothetical protein